METASSSSSLSVVQPPEEDLAVGAGRDEDAAVVRGAEGADVDVGGLVVAREQRPGRHLHLFQELCKRRGWKTKILWEGSILEMMSLGGYYFLPGTVENTSTGPGRK